MLPRRKTKESMKHKQKKKTKKTQQVLTLIPRDNSITDGQV